MQSSFTRVDFSAKPVARLEIEFAGDGCHSLSVSHSPRHSLDYLNAHEEADAAHREEESPREKLFLPPNTPTPVILHNRLAEVISTLPLCITPFSLSVPFPTRKSISAPPSPRTKSQRTLKEFGPRVSAAVQLSFHSSHSPPHPHPSLPVASPSYHPTILTRHS